jgi:peptide/nickel transport system substrate-binding protein
MAVNSLVRGAAALLILVAASTTAARAAQDRFVVDLASEPSTLDPHIQWNPDSYFVYRNIFDNLLTRDDKGAIVPEIATAWRQVSDTTLEFDIRTDVSFHDGSKLTAEDVVFSIKRIIDPKFGSPQLSQFSKIADATRDGPSKVVIQLKSPYSAILAQLVKLSIVPRHLVEKEGNDKFNLNPIGSGPYKFISWDRGVAVTLARNDAYWGRKGPFPQAVFRAVPNAATRLADVQANAADLARAMNSDQGKQLDDSGRGKRLYALTERSAYLRINPNRPPFDNLKIRQALSYAIDKEGITEGILGGLDKPIDEMVTPVTFGWSGGVKGTGYDPEKAKALLKEAGVPPHFDFLVGTFFDQRVVQAVLQQLKEVGFNASISLVDTATFLKAIQQGPKDGPALAISTNSCACQDADGMLNYLLHSGSNWAITTSVELDKLLDEAGASTDEKKRLALYSQLNALIADQVLSLPLYQMTAIFAASKKLQWNPTPNESFFLNRMNWVE